MSIDDDDNVVVIAECNQSFETNANKFEAIICGPTHSETEGALQYDHHVPETLAMTGAATNTLIVGYPECNFQSFEEPIKEPFKEPNLS